MRPEHTCVMIVSAHSMIGFVAGSVQAGAMGYLTKQSEPAGILKCLDTISEGKRFVDNSLSENLCELFVSLDLPAPEESDIPGNYEKLSEREQEVMHLSVAGLSVRKIAE